MKYHNLFTGKRNNMKNISVCHLLKILPGPAQRVVKGIKGTRASQ